MTKTEKLPADWHIQFREKILGLDIHALDCERCNAPEIMAILTDAVCLPLLIERKEMSKAAFAGAVICPRCANMRLYSLGNLGLVTP